MKPTGTCFLSGWISSLIILAGNSYSFSEYTNVISSQRKLFKSTPSCCSPLFGSSLILPNLFQGSNNHTDGNFKEKNSHDPQKLKKSSESNFWYSVPLQHEEELLPNMPYLDSDGELPKNAYQVLSSTNENISTFGKKQTCLLTVAIGLDSRNIGSSIFQLADVDSIVQGMQKLIDSGLTSFQIGQSGGTSMQMWGESNIYKTLKQMTPSSVLDNCHLSTRVNIPASPSWMKDPKKIKKAEDMINDTGAGFGYGRGEEIRRAISGSLLRMETDILDSVQVVYRDDSPYYLDTLNTLFELQEEGKIRSITGLSVPPTIVQIAEENGFILDSNQAVCNIIDQRSLTDYPPESETKMLYSNALLGGILSDPFFFTRGKEPDLVDLSPSQRKNLNSIRSWGKSVKRRERVHSWTLFHKYILSTLYELSQQYQVSMSSIALRYIMQKTANSNSRQASTLGSMIIGSRVGFSEDWMDSRPNQLREVFTFELVDEHIERLDELSSLGHLPELYPSAEQDILEYL